jgi:hypothetical protein
MLVLALALAAATAQPPPAHLHVPKALREARSAKGDEAPLPPSLFASPDVLEALGALVPEVGAWVEYAVRSKGGPAARIKLSILPPRLDGGRYWLEIDSATEDGTTSAAKLLVHGNPARAQDLERAFIYVVGQAPIEVPLGEVADRLAAEPLPAPSGKKVLKPAPQDVEVKAGSFPKAEVLEVAGTRIWRSPRVPLWGVVRSRGAGQTLELIGFARHGAHSLMPDLDQGTGSDSVK